MTKRKLDIIEGDAETTTRLVSVELRVAQQVVTPSPNGLRALLAEWGLTNAAQESLWVISYDGTRNIRTITPVAVGTYHNVIVSIPAVLSAVLLSGTDRFIVAHNHPNGVTVPTDLDFQLTQRIATAAQIVGLYFEDHLIVGPPDRWYSMVADGAFTANTEPLAQLAFAGAIRGVKSAGAPVIFEDFDHRGD